MSHGHAIAGPSSATTWMTCPASITLAQGRVRPSSKYAREGTVAHHIAEEVINGNLFPPAKVEVEGDTFVVGRDMLQHLNPYITLVEMLRQQVDCKVYTEQRVGLAISKGLVWGTADCIAVTPHKLTIADLKFGEGVPVLPDSAQLKIYALGALEKYGTASIRLVDLIIMQPRLDPTPQVYNTTRTALMNWALAELIPAVGRLTAGDTTEVAGAHCRWCVRRDECKAFAKLRSGRAADIFDDGLELLESNP